ncbi:hypothetical protein LY04_01994 [Oceanimonas baumannii]|uniref:Uncharacterized protein n=1 Tax=Oceanimonas baumannii TaxID=129578 RepID=A0ABY2EY25_9GAMM|nr:hypothetical protein LY04_01994 [Oceanimonas baumannii]
MPSIFVQWLHNTGHGPKMKAIAVKIEVFQNRLAGRAYKDMTRSVDKIDTGRLDDAVAIKHTDR